MANKKKGFERVEFQILESQHKQLIKNAQKKGVTLSEYLRTILHPFMNLSRDL